MEYTELQDKFSKYKQLDCSKYGHDDKLNMICLRQYCENLMEPVCINCVDKKFHNHGKFLNLKQFLIDITEQVTESALKIKDINNKTNEWYKNMAEKFKQLGDKCYEISANVQKMHKHTKSKQMQEHYQLIKQLLQEISKGNQQVLKDNLKQMKNHIDIKEDYSFSIKTEIEQDNFFPIQNYQSRMNKCFDYLNENIKFSLYQSGINNKVSWEFVKSQFEKSQDLMCDEEGLIYQGTNNGFQTVYSSATFDRGVHGFIIKIEDLGEVQDHFMIGILPGEQMDTSPYLFPHRCLFCNSCYQIMNEPSNQMLGTHLEKGDCIKVLLDFEAGDISITDNKKRVTYYLKDYKDPLKKNGWKFFIYWFSDIKISLQEAW